MATYPDPPKGWAELQARMARVTTSEQINEILKEMHQVLRAYEDEIAGGQDKAISPDLFKDQQSRNSA